MKKTLAAAVASSVLLMATPALADGHMMVEASDQSVAGGTVTASKIMTTANGWLVVHRVKPDGKPGPVVGYAPLKKGANMDVTAILSGNVKKGDKLMLMIHGEAGGKKTGIFEYTLGSKLDGPLRDHGKLVVAVITTQ